MGNPSDQKMSPTRCEQRLLRLLAILSCLGLTACGPSPEEAVEGIYRVDLSKVKSTEEWGFLDGQPERWSALLSKQMLKGVRYTIRDGACQRGIAGRPKKLDCEFVRVDKKKIVVYRSVDSIGRIQFLRATLTKQGVDLEIDGHIVPLIKEDTAAGS